MTLGDGIRRNVAQVDPAERMLLRQAIIEMHHRYFPGGRGDSLPGGVSWWFKQDEIHQATHVHGGPEFLPWHREITNHFEELLRQINPQLSLHYWDFKDDPRSAPDGHGGTVNLFSDLLPDGKPFMGSPGIQENIDPNGGPIGEPWLSAGFYDPQAGTGGSHPQDRETSGNPVDPPKSVMRPSNYPGPPPAPLIAVAQENHILGLQQFGPGIPQNHSNDANFNANVKPFFFRTAWEDIHNAAHPYFADISPHDAFRDPFVFLIHSNVDRLYSLWQLDPAHPDRLNTNTIYGSESNMDVDVIAVGTHSVQNLTHLVEPWSTGHGDFSDIRPWEPTHENQGFLHDYHHISVVAPACYDTNPTNFRIDEVENPFNASTNRYQVIFNDVPEEETTWRPSVIRVYTCTDTTLRVTAATIPAAPFGVAVGQARALRGAHPHEYQDVRIWFQYTAGAVGTAPHSDGPVNVTIHCDETGQDFLFELRANTIHRPTVAVEMVLDQSGSMAWAAGTSGLTRLQVLKDAANLFATLIQDNNAIGITRFDDHAYASNDATYPGLPIIRVVSQTERNAAQAAIDAHGAHGGTSVGNGLVMGHGELGAVPAGSYDKNVMLVLTDGVENQPISIAQAIGLGAVDAEVHAVGLGNEFQVNTAALNSISARGVLLSGVLTPDTDDYFRVKKFFLQILAGATNTSIVRDPVGYINGGTRITVPFDLSEADINCRVILLTDYPVVNLAVQAPDGTLIDPAGGPALGVTFGTVGTTTTASFALPVPMPAQPAQAGTWMAILEVDRARYKRQLSALRDENPASAAALEAKGARYSVSMHSFSNLRMTSEITQDGYQVGSTLTVRAVLTEYRQPVANRARLDADVQRPDGTHTVLHLSEVDPGVFEIPMIASLSGIYRLTITAKGATHLGAPFEREEIRTTAVFHDIQPVGGSTDNGCDLCDILKCLTDQDHLGPRIDQMLREHEVDIDGIRQCLNRHTDTDQ